MLICALHMNIVDLYLAHVGSREPMVWVENVKSTVLLEGVVVRWVEDDLNEGDDDHEDDDDDDGDDHNDYEDAHDDNDDDDNHNDDDHDDHLSRGGQDCP